mgnify:FL=1
MVFDAIVEATYTALGWMLFLGILGVLASAIAGWMPGLYIFGILGLTGGLSLWFGMPLAMFVLACCTSKWSSGNYYRRG